MSLKITEGLEDVLQRSLDTWGLDDQFGMANEEFGECITAINQYKRGRIDEDKLASEVADAFIMAGQLAQYLGNERVQQHIDFKMNRLKGRIENYQSQMGTQV